MKKYYGKANLESLEIIYIIWAIFGIVFLYNVLGRFFVKSYMQKRTEYFITNKRVLVVRNLSKTKVDSENISNIQGIDKNVKNSEQSKVIFGKSPILYSLYENTYMFENANAIFQGLRKSGNVIYPLGFYDLKAEDAEKAYETAEKLISEK